MQHATLAAHAALNTDDLLGEALPAPYGTLRVSSSSPFTGWARVYNDSPGGTYGQYVPLSNVSPSRAVPGGALFLFKTGFAGGLRTAGESSRIQRPVPELAIAEVSGSAAVALEVDPAGGWSFLRERSLRSAASHSSTF